MTTRWFMSYVYRLEGIPEEMHYGCTVSDGEHPMVKIQRWNKEMQHRKMILLYYRELAEAEIASGFDQDFDIEF